LWTTECKPMNKTILVVENPLQFLNACEAIYFFKLKNYTLFVRYPNSAINMQNDDLLSKVFPELSHHVVKMRIRGARKTPLDYVQLAWFFLYFLVVSRRFDLIILGGILW